MPISSPAISVPSTKCACSILWVRFFATVLTPVCFVTTFRSIPFGLACAAHAAIESRVTRQGHEGSRSFFDLAAPPPQEVDILRSRTCDPSARRRCGTIPGDKQNLRLWPEIVNYGFECTDVGAGKMKGTPSHSLSGWQSLSNHVLKV